MIVMGLMSGTSCDGCDVSIVEIEEGRPKLLFFYSKEYPEELRKRIRRCMDREKGTVDLITQVNFEIGHFFGEVAKEAMVKSGITPHLIASHGQTIYHIPRPDQNKGEKTKSTFQIGEAACIVEKTGIPVISDFRVQDVAAGGDGAPLVPMADFIMFREEEISVAIHNIGGISNLTYIPKGANPEDVIAFDTGPGNVLINQLTRELFDMEYDSEGKIAREGKIHMEIVNKLLEHPYFNLNPPKSTGPEEFNIDLLREYINRVPGKDLLASVTFFTAKSIAMAYKRYVIPLGLDKILVAGGGAYNRSLIEWIKAELKEIPVYTFEEKGLNSKARESMAFAILGYLAWNKKPNNLPQVTGARHPVIMGKISFPYSSR